MVKPKVGDLVRIREDAHEIADYAGWLGTVADILGERHAFPYRIKLLATGKYLHVALEELELS